MTKVVPVGFHGAEGDSAQAVDFQDVLDASWGGDYEDVGLFAGADLVPDGEDRGVFLVCVEREVIEAAVGEAVAVIFRILSSGYEIRFCEDGDAFVGAAATAEV